MQLQQIFVWEDCENKNCSNKLHHMCQNNIDNIQYNSEFEIKFSLVFRCSKCIEECMNIESPRKILFDTESERKMKSLM